MNARERIKEALKSRLLEDYITDIPDRGAEQDEIQIEEKKIGRKLSKQHKDILLTWNGILLEIVSFYGCGDLELPYRSLYDWQYIIEENELSKNEFIAFGDNPAGIIFLENKKGEIFVLDPIGNILLQKLAVNMDEFVCKYMFGDKGNFFGDDWLEELKTASLVD